MRIAERIRGRYAVMRRHRFLALNPLCQSCAYGNCRHKHRTADPFGVACLRLAGSPLCVRPAKEVDHIVPLHKGGPDKWHNLQGLCDDCHKDKTRLDMGHGPAKPETGMDGWPV